MAPDFRPIVLIPVYDHERCLNDIVTSLRRKGLPVLLADDASHAACAREIRRIAAGTDGVFSVHHAVNGGKGAAVVTGFEVASDLGFTHVLQIDADGQHDHIRDTCIPAFLCVNIPLVLVCTVAACLI